MQRFLQLRAEALGLPPNHVEVRSQVASVVALLVDAAQQLLTEKSPRAISGRELRFALVRWLAYLPVSA